MNLFPKLQNNIDAADQCWGEPAAEEYTIGVPGVLGRLVPQLSREPDPTAVHGDGGFPGVYSSIRSLISYLQKTSFSLGLVQCLA